MASVTQVRQYILFALDELSARNGQYEFENLCQEVIRARVASNLVAATGPVNAKGDQGRDAETFTTGLQDELGPHGPFLGKVSGEPAAFCMTIQKAGLAAKFLADANKIVADGEAVARIYAFCTERIAVGVRHTDAADIAKEVGVPVEILDGKWLSEQIATNELFWVAERYLDLPAELRLDDAPDSEAQVAAPYATAREHWQARKQPAVTRGDFHDLRRCLRFANEPGEGRPDLPFWMDRLRQLLDSEDADLVLRVRYELIVAHIVGLRDLGVPPL